MSVPSSTTNETVRVAVEGASPAVANRTERSASRYSSSVAVPESESVPAAKLPVMPFWSTNSSTSPGSKPAVIETVAAISCVSSGSATVSAGATSLAGPFSV